MREPQQGRIEINWLVKDTSRYLTLQPTNQRLNRRVATLDVFRSASPALTRSRPLARPCGPLPPRQIPKTASQAVLVSSTKAWRKGCQGQAELKGIPASANWRCLVRWRKKQTLGWVEAAPGAGAFRGIEMSLLTSAATRSGWTIGLHSGRGGGPTRQAGQRSALPAKQRLNRRVATLDVFRSASSPRPSPPLKRGGEGAMGGRWRQVC